MRVHRNGPYQVVDWWHAVCDVHGDLTVAHRDGRRSSQRRVSDPRAPSPAALPRWLRFRAVWLARVLRPRAPPWAPAAWAGWADPEGESQAAAWDGRPASAARAGGPHHGG